MVGGQVMNQALAVVQIIGQGFRRIYVFDAAAVGEFAKGGLWSGPDKIVQGSIFAVESGLAGV